MSNVPQVETFKAADNVWCVLCQGMWVEWVPLVNWLLERSWGKLPEELKKEILAICEEKL